MWLTVSSHSVWLLSQVTDPGSLDFRQLGIAAVVCALLLADDLMQRKECKGVRAEMATLQLAYSKLLEERAEREKEIGAETVPMLVRCADLLLIITGRAEAPHASVEQDLAVAVERLTNTVKKLDPNPD